MRRDTIVKEALSWIGTPFHDQQCVKSVGVDCAMLLFGIAKNTGLIDKDTPRPVYSPELVRYQTESELEKNVIQYGCKEITTNKMKKGDVLLFRLYKTIGHAAIYVGDDKIVHALKRPGYVACVSLSGVWKERLEKVYKFPGVR